MLKSPIFTESDARSKLRLSLNDKIIQISCPTSTMREQTNIVVSAREGKRKERHKNHLEQDNNIKPMKVGKKQR